MNPLTRWRNRRALNRLLGMQPKEVAALVAKQDDIPGQGNVNVGGWEILGRGFTGFIEASEIWNSYGTTDLEKMYKASSVVFAAVWKIASTAGEATPQIGRQTKKGWKTDETHYLNETLLKPNPLMSHSDFIAQHLIHLLLTGTGWIWEFRNNAQQITELWPVPTSWVRQIGDRYEIWQNGNQWTSVNPRDLTKQYLPDPQNPTNGMSPFTAASRDYDLDKERENYIAEMLINLKVPGLILKQEGGWIEDDKHDIRAMLMDRIGRGHRGNPIFLEGKESEVTMVAPLKDLDWPGLSTLSETRLCAVVGVPPMILQLRSGLERSTFSNMAEARTFFYASTMTAIWKALGEAETRGFIHNEKDESNLEIWYDTSDIPELQEDQGKRAERACGLFNGGLVTRNEGREMAGLDPVEDKSVGDVFLQAINLIPIPADGSQLALPLPPKDEGEEEWETEEEPAEGEGEEPEGEGEDEEGEE